MQTFLCGQGSFGTDGGYCLHGRLHHHTILDPPAHGLRRHAEQVTLSGNQMRALLAAAYNGLRPVLVSDRTPSVVELAARRGPV